MVKDHSQDLMAAGLGPCVSERTEAQIKVIRGHSGDLRSTKMWRERWKDKQKPRKEDERMQAPEEYGLAAQHLL